MQESTLFPQSGTLDLALGYTVVEMGLKHKRFSADHPINLKNAMAGTERVYRDRQKSGSTWSHAVFQQGLIL